jgi:hypothetical protein
VPTDYRLPTGDHRVLIGVERSSNTHGRADVVESTGVLTPRSAAAIAYFSLDGIRFSVSEEDTNGWTAVPAYSNGWGDFGSPWVRGEYRMVGDLVQLRGLINAGTIGSTAFTLPTGMRPPRGYHFGTDTSANAHGQVRIDTDGSVVPSNGSNVYISLTGIEFSVSPPGTDGWKPLELVNSWQNVDEELWVPAEYRQRGTEVELRGLVTGGTTATTIATLPWPARPSSKQIWCVTATGAHGRMDINSRSGDIRCVAGATLTYFSMNRRFSTLS